MHPNFFSVPHVVFPKALTVDRDNTAKTKLPVVHLVRSAGFAGVFLFAQYRFRSLTILFSTVSNPSVCHDSLLGSTSHGPHGKSAGTPQLPISMPVDLTSLSNSAFVRFAIGLQTKKEICIRSGTNKSSHMHVIMCECACDLVCPHFERVLRFPASASSLLTTGPSPASVISKTRAF